MSVISEHLDSESPKLQVLRARVVEGIGLELRRRLRRPPFGLLLPESHHDFRDADSKFGLGV